MNIRPVHMYYVNLTSADGCLISAPNSPPVSMFSRGQYRRQIAWTLISDHSAGRARFMLRRVDWVAAG